MLLSGLVYSVLKANDVEPPSVKREAETFGDPPRCCIALRAFVADTLSTAYEFERERRDGGTAEAASAMIGRCFNVYFYRIGVREVIYRRGACDLVSADRDGQRSVFRYIVGIGLVQEPTFV